MKKLLLFVFATLAFAACTQDVVVDITPAPIVDNAPETLVVGFEGDDTRIQLQNGKTVWTEGDLVSVFYRSDANQKWQYRGETGSRTAELKRVDAGTATTPTTAVVVVYPYDANYYLNTRTFNIQATLPAVQSYLEDSYGLGGNIMISQSEYNQFSLKSVCGWLKLQLTGNGEKISSITLRGNNGEQVAGELYINSADATVLLAADMGSADDNNAGGSLIFDDTILKEVTLDCGEGVTLGAEATAFYIALPPQTFTQGLTVEITDDSGYTMTQATDKEVAIERNHIQPMAEMEFTPSVPNNQIWYTATKKAEPRNNNAFGATIISNEWDSETGNGIITFDGNVTTIGYEAFWGCDSLTSVNIPDSVTTIGDFAFWRCDSLTSVNIPDGVTMIGEGAFADCHSLTSVNIPDSVTTIGERAFASCSNLREFTGKFAEDNGRILVVDGVLTAFAPAGITEYNIPESVTMIRQYAFYECRSLTSVNIPNSVTTIGDFAFQHCYSLTSVNIPDSVATIGNYAFEGCSLTSITIGNSVTTIGNDAFIGCGSLKYVYCKPTTPPALGNSNVFGYNASGRRIIVPIGSGEAYKTAKNWSEYANDIIEDEF